MAPLDASMSLSVGTLFVDTFMLFLASIFVGLRFWARWTKRTRLQVNDYTIIVAWVRTFGLTMCSGGARKLAYECRSLLWLSLQR